MLTAYVSSIIHSAFIVLAAGGVIRVYFSPKREDFQSELEPDDDQLIKSQEEIIRFHEWRMQLPQPGPTAG
jgi:hypothetical protein